MSSERDDGGPAFPCCVLDVANCDFKKRLGWTPQASLGLHVCGMSLRAWLTGTVAAGLRASEKDTDGTMMTSEQLAKWSVEDADAIIAELKK